MDRRFSIRRTWHNIGKAAGEGDKDRFHARWLAQQKRETSPLTPPPTVWGPHTHRNKNGQSHAYPVQRLSLRLVAHWRRRQHAHLSLQSRQEDRQAGKQASKHRER